MSGFFFYLGVEGSGGGAAGGGGGIVVMSDVRFNKGSVKTRLQVILLSFFFFFLTNAVNVFALQEQRLTFWEKVGPQ